MEGTFCLADVVLVAITAVYPVDDAGFVEFVGFVFGGNKLTADGIGGLGMDCDPQFPDLPGQSFIHASNVGDGDVSLAFQLFTRWSLGGDCTFHAARAVPGPHLVARDGEHFLQVLFLFLFGLLSGADGVGSVG